MNYCNIPIPLRQHAYWCVWKYEECRGKIPYNPSTGHRAKSNDRNTFSDYYTTFNFQVSREKSSQ